MLIGRENLFPKRTTSNDYDKGIINKRIKWLSKRMGIRLKYINTNSAKTIDMKQNVENFIGMAQIPIGIAGPLKVNGEYAKGLFYVPFATTQGTLVDSYYRGMLAITASGGAKTYIHKDKIDISPVFILKDLNSASEFTSWVTENFHNIKAKAEETTNHGKLLEIKSYIVGRRVLLNFCYFTEDAMGLNIINIATDYACRYIAEKKSESIDNWYLRCNLSSDKKPSFFNLITGYGKVVSAEVIFPKEVVKKFFRTTPEQMYSFWYSSLFGSFYGGMIGTNAHYANGLAAIFMACGQDVAQVVNSSIGISSVEITKEGDLYISVNCPCLIIGTVGGGTSLPTQRECLEMLGCYGKGKVKKFAEIIAATLLAGEVSLCAALSSHIHAQVDVALRKR